MNKIFETTRFVVEHSSSVRIEKEKIIDFSKSFPYDNLSHWLTGSPISYAHLNDSDKLNFLLVFNSTSFCYRGDPKWAVEYKGNKYDGSWAMIASIMRAIDEGKPILNAEYRASIDSDEYREILRGNIEIPLFDKRWAITKEVASVLVEKYGGDFSNLIKHGGGDAAKILELIISEIPSFKDVEIYQDKEIYFYKRAQLLIEDIYQAFNGKGYGNLNNIQGFTACADYKLPQSLRKLGIISYSEELANKIDCLVQIPQGSPEEVEIRANTIWAVEAIKDQLEKMGKRVPTMEINDHLWLMGQVKNSDDKPYHRTLTTAY